MKIAMNFLNNIRQSFLVALALACSLGMSNTAFAQASLAAENIIDDIVVETDRGELKTYTVFRDKKERNQWYYMPNEIRLAEDVVNGKKQPKIKILKYQYQKDNKELKQGGIVSASFTFAMFPEVKEDVEAYIRKKTGNQNIRLSAIPFVSSKIHLMTGNMEAGNDQVKTINGPTTANQEMVVNYKLDELGASVMKGLFTGKDGFPVSASVTYNGLLPPCGYKVTGKWNNVYNYFDKQSKKEGGASFWFIKASATDTKRKTRETHIRNSGVTIKKSGCDSMQSAIMNARMDQVVAKIENLVYSAGVIKEYKDLQALEAMLLNAKNDTTKARIIDQMTSGTKKLQLGYQRSIVDVKKRQKGKISFSFSEEQLVRRSTTFGSLIGFGPYELSEEDLVEQGYVMNIDVNQEFPTVLFGLPDINEAFNLRSLTYNISYTNSDGSIISEARQWSGATKKWTTPLGEEVNFLRFTMIGENDKSRVNQPVFDIKLNVVSNELNASFSVEKSIKLNRGEHIADALELLTEQIMIAGDILSFKKITNDANDLLTAQVKFEKGDIKIRKSIKPYVVNSVYGPPTPVYFLLPINDSTASSKVTYFKMENGRRKTAVEENIIEMGENDLLPPEWPEESGE